MIHVGRFLSFFFFERKGGLETAVDYQRTLHFDISWEHRNQKKTKKEKRDRENLNLHFSATMCFISQYDAHLTKLTCDPHVCSAMNLRVLTCVCVKSAVYFLY